MSINWSGFFSQSIELKNYCETDFVSLLSDLSAYYISGADASSFLQNQLSNDINALEKGGLQFSAYCTPKGRMIALYLVTPHDQGFILIAPKTVMQGSIDRLKKYVLMSEVTMQDCSDWCICGLVGNKAIEFFQQQQLQLDAWQANTLDQCTVLRLSGSSGRYLLLGPGNAVQSLLSKIQDINLAGINAWQWHKILNGEADVFEQTVEMFIPQMLNLQAMNGLSFTKGCYPGQEIVARTQYRGTLKRRMYMAEVDYAQAILPGESLWVHDEQFDKDEVAGNVVISAGNGEKSLLLAVIQNKFSEQSLCVTDMQGPKIKLLELPYTLETE